MGIHKKIDLLSDADADALVTADDLLQTALRDFAQETFRKANTQNREAYGDFVPYTAEMGGQKYTGRGELLPVNQLIIFQRSANIQKSQASTLIVNRLWGAVRRRAINAALRKALLAAGIAFDPVEAAKWTYRGIRLLGRLSAREDRENDVLIWIAQELFDRSPVLSGAYRDAHTLFADGAEVGSAEDVFNSAEVPEASEYVFVNSIEYGRKIEVGRTREWRDFVIQVQGHIYEGVAADAAGKFNDVAQIGSEWRGEGSLPVLERGKTGRALLYPAIVVRTK